MQMELVGAGPSSPQNGSGCAVHTTRLPRATCWNPTLTLKPNWNFEKLQNPGSKNQGILPMPTSGKMVLALDRFTCTNVTLWCYERITSMSDTLY